MTVESRRAAAFVRAYWDEYPAVLAACDELSVRDPEGLKQRAERAWTVRDARLLAAAAAALAGRGMLEPDLCEKAGIALYEHDRPDQQLRFLTDPMLGRQPRVWFHLARAWAKTGRWSEARTQAESAVAERRDARAAGHLLTQVAEAERLSAVAAGSDDWFDQRRGLEALMALRAHGPAAALCERALTLPISPKRNRLRPLCRVLDAALSLGLDQERIAAVLAAARERHPEDADVRALQLDGEALAGRAAQALDRAAGEPPPDDAYGDGTWDFALANARLEAGRTRDAVAALGELTLAHPRDQEMRSALACGVGMLALAGAPDRPRGPRRRPKIVNVFPFNDELALLRIRLNEMADWVDTFVLVEAAQTFVGNPKPLVFQDHQGEFAAFGDKIVHLTVDAFPDYVRANWARDFHQRDAAGPLLAELCGDEDLVLVTDVDEIVDRRALEGFEGDFARLHMPFHRFFLNYRPAPGNHLRNARTGAVWRARLLRRYGLSYARFRLSRLEKAWARIEHAGWHFSSVGDAQRIAGKFANYAHQERALDPHRDSLEIEKLLAELKAGRVQDGWERCEIDDSFPAYVREHQRELADIIL